MRETFEQSEESHGELVKRLRRRPLTAESRVRFPYSLLWRDYRKVISFVMWCAVSVFVLYYLCKALAFYDMECYTMLEIWIMKEWACESTLSRL